MVSISEEGISIQSVKQNKNIQIPIEFLATHGTQEGNQLFLYISQNQEQEDDEG